MRQRFFKNIRRKEKFFKKSYKNMKNKRNHKKFKIKNSWKKSKGSKVRWIGNS